MSSSIHVTVDTEPMAESVHRVTHHVDATIAAIVAMEAATVAAEQSAANNICENVNRGFHSLLLSQVSQKCAKAKSVVDAKLQELLHLESSLRRVREQMEHDFHRIANRYLKIFKNLDNSLRARVCELDKPTADLTIRQMPEAERRMLGCGVQTPVHQSESLNAAQSIVSSAMRVRAMKALDHMQGMLQKTATLQATMIRIVDEKHVESSTRVLIPAIMLESDDLNLLISTQRIYLPAKFHQITVAVQEAFRAVPWDSTGSSSDAVRKQVQLYLAQAALPDRVRSKALELFAGVRWQQTRAGGT